MTNGQAQELLEKTARGLGEHFDAVQIMVTWISDEGTGNTKCLKRGCGNWYARRGMAQELIEEDNAQLAADSIGKELKDPPEDWQTAT